jgi:leader peptidase (prepilin peptidase) / N-methyltransferase
MNPPIEFAGMPWVPLALALMVGALIGSFINVVVYRLPRMLERQWHEECAHLRDESVPAQETFNLATPRSACPQCGEMIRWFENVPVLSFVLQRGRCNHCGAAIAWRYPLVESATALLTAFAVWHFGANSSGIAAAVLIWCLIALTFIDYDTQLLPDNITLPLIWLGLLWNLYGGFVPLQDAVIGAVAGYLVLWSVYQLFKLITGKEGMGYGDFKLLAALGAWLGWGLLPVILLASSLVGALIGTAMIVLAGHDRAKPLPFGPYLALGGMLALFWGERIVQTYLQS